MFKKILFLLISSFFSLIAKGQNNDTISRKLEIDNKSFNIYFGAGYQKKFYYEIGLAHGRFQGGHGSLVHFGYFANYERTLGTENFSPVNGIKTGIFLGGLSGAITTELKYLWYKNNYDWVLTPKYAIGLGGIFGFNYGYNISFYNRPFPQIGKHQFSLTFNIPFIKPINMLK